MTTVSKYIINPQSGIGFTVTKGQYIKIIDVEGKQSGDFFAVNKNDTTEYFSSGVTLDNNANFYLKKGDFLYSNKYNQILQIVEDTVGYHDLIHPTCSPRMFETQYGVKGFHPSCHHNIQKSLADYNIEYNDLHTVFNFFMNTRIEQNGDIKISASTAMPGDHIILKAFTDLIVAVTSCSVTQSKTNSFSAKPLGIEILDEL